MNVTIHAHNFKVTDNLEAYARKKLDRLDRFLPNISDIRVDLSRQETARGEDITIAQITLRHKRGAILRAEEKHRSNDRDSAQAAINLAVEKMHRQIERFKGKRNRKGQERFTATLEEIQLAEETSEFEAIDATIAVPEVVYQEPEIVRRKDVKVTPMTEVEAVEQMELLGHDFFVFFNANTSSVNVLYRRGEGGYGVLVPQTE